VASREVEKLRRQKSRSLSRKKPARATFPTLLIVCEGRNTEPSYFNYHQGGALHRNHYADLINRAIRPLGAWYDAAGSKIITPEFFHLLFGYDTKYKKRRVDLAIERAKRIYERYSHQSPADEESSTTVHVLLDHLLAFSRPNNTREGM